MTYIIDGKNMCTRDAAHAELAHVLNLPEHYGMNLDALWDHVTTMDAELALIHPAPMLNALGIYGCKLIQLLYEAMDSNIGFRFHVQD